MTVHSFHIFDRRGKTLFTKRYSTAAKAPQAQPQDDIDEDEFLSEQRKLVFGMLFSLRELSGSLAPEGKTAGKKKMREMALFLLQSSMTHGTSCFQQSPESFLSPPLGISSVFFCSCILGEDRSYNITQL
jgi:hypothetical protein